MASQHSYRAGRVLARTVLIVGVCGLIGGCARRAFPPVRDPEAYMLELFRIEVPETVGRRHPEIEEVLKKRRTRLLDRLPAVRIGADQEVGLEHGDGAEVVAVRASLRDLSGGIASLSLRVRPWLDTDVEIRLPLDTWGAIVCGVDSARDSVQILVCRVNRPAGETPRP